MPVTGFLLSKCPSWNTHSNTHCRIPTPKHSFLNTHKYPFRITIPTLCVCACVRACVCARARVCVCLRSLYSLLAAYVIYMYNTYTVLFADNNYKWSTSTICQCRRSRLPMPSLLSYSLQTLDTGLFTRQRPTCTSTRSFFFVH